MPIPENYNQANEITFRMSLTLLIGPQVSEHLVSRGAKDQPLCTLVTAASSILSAGFSTKCLLVSFASPLSEVALSSTAVQCYFTLLVK